MGLSTWCNHGIPWNKMRLQFFHIRHTVRPKKHCQSTCPRWIWWWFCRFVTSHFRRSPEKNKDNLSVGTTSFQMPLVARQSLKTWITSLTHNDRIHKLSRLIRLFILPTLVSKRCWRASQKKNLTFRVLRNFHGSCQTISFGFYELPRILP